jgi:hypothetical protein
MKLLRVNALMMQGIIGKSQSTVMIIDDETFYPGDQIEVRCFSSADDQPTGLWCHRWIIDVRCIPCNVDDDVFYELELSAFRPEGLPLGLSRVLKSDNLESF